MIFRFSVKLDSIVADHLARISFMMSVFVLSFFRYFNLCNNPAEANDA